MSTAIVYKALRVRFSQTLLTASVLALLVHSGTAEAKHHRLHIGGWAGHQVHRFGGFVSTAAHQARTNASHAGHEWHRFWVEVGRWGPSIDHATKHIRGFFEDECDRDDSDQKEECDKNSQEPEPAVAKSENPSSSATSDEGSESQDEDTANRSPKPLDLNSREQTAANATSDDLRWVYRPGMLTGHADNRDDDRSLLLSDTDPSFEDDGYKQSLERHLSPKIIREGADVLDTLLDEGTKNAPPSVIIAKVLFKSNLDNSVKPEDATKNFTEAAVDAVEIGSKALLRYLAKDAARRVLIESVGDVLIEGPVAAVHLACEAECTAIEPFDENPPQRHEIPCDAAIANCKNENPLSPQSKDTFE